MVLAVAAGAAAVTGAGVAGIVAAGAAAGVKN